MRRALYLLPAAAAVAWLAFGVAAWRGRAVRRGAPPPAAASTESRGAWHVHTRASDGRGTLPEVAAAARDAGLDFLVVTDHNRREPDAPAYLDGVLVIPATEASTVFGHVAALGLARPLSPAERDGDPLEAIRAAGGVAVLAHPLHPERPFTGWGKGPWRGLEVVSNDTAWYRVLADKDLPRLLAAVVVLPFDPPRAVLALADDPADELARLDAEAVAARGRGEPPPALFCSADAHGWPAYRAAFEAFSMHVPVRRTGDAARDAAAIEAALARGDAACVFEGIAPAAGVRFTAGRARTALDFDAGSAPPGPVEVTLWRDGAALGGASPALAPGPNRVELGHLCGRHGCGPGDYRVAVTAAGRPWIFTNPARIE